jgi:protein SCO1/2
LKAALLFLLAFAGAVHAEGGLKSGVFEPPRDAPDFTLDGSDGKALALSAYRGKVVLLGFGFTHCGYVCPTTLATLAKTRRKLGPGAKDLQVVYVTVDPERDSPERLRTYLASFDPSFIGGTGKPGELGKVRQAYGIVARKVGTDPASYAIEHSSFVYLIDRAGSLRAMSPYGSSADDIAHDVAILLKK